MKLQMKWGAGVIFFLTWRCMYLYFQFTILWYFKNFYVFKLWWTWTECTHYVYHYAGFVWPIQRFHQRSRSCKVIWNTFLPLICQYGNIDTVTISIKYYHVLIEICWSFKYTWFHCHQVSSSQYSALCLSFDLKFMNFSFENWGVS